MQEFINKINYISILKVSAIIIFGTIFLKILKIGLKKILRKKFTIHTRKIIIKTIYWLVVIVLIITVLDQLGIKLTALISALGIAGVAIGFAAQTSFSNIISGIFLITERSFEIGDIVEVGSNTGRIISIDLLSIKMKTFNNQLVRIPNEEMIKSQVTNVTKYPIRRLDLNIGVAYKENVKKVKDLLFEIAEKDKYCLKSPEPQFRFKNFGDSALEFLFGVWINSDEYFDAKNSMMEAIKDKFDEKNIEIPFPHITFYTGEETKDLPVRLNDNAKK
ncbi:MAG TPA: mechanosensitive ion channel family protein [Candidatus Mcinerneyibacterium sp.]|nr:mechanosensitive ion channel family protein [Candidatus Mcinerneyibacterium sp.]